MKTGRRPGARASLRRGFTLLEIILALAILAGGVAVLGEANRLAQRNARHARDLSQASLIAASKLAEVTSGIAVLESVNQVPVETEPGWLYSLSVEPVDENLGLLAVRVTVIQDIPPASRPVELSLVRWIADPEVVAAQQNAASSASDGAASNDYSPEQSPPPGEFE